MSSQTHPEPTPDETPRAPTDTETGAADPGIPAHVQAGFREKPVSFVRRGGRLTDGQERGWSELRERFLITAPRAVAETSVHPDARFDAAAAFGREAPLIVEIGSGQGEAVLHAAQAHPETNFLAVEVFIAGLAKTMLGAEREGLRNVRVMEANAPEVLRTFLPEASVDELWVFFPDPWHKSKHNKRRLVTAEFAALAARALRPGGLLRLATDWEDYARQQRRVMDAAPDFVREFDADPAAWAPRFEGRTLTSFEAKGVRRGHSIRDMLYRRR